MTCSQCKTTWNDTEASKDLTRCPFCGASLREAPAVAVYDAAALKKAEADIKALTRTRDMLGFFRKKEKQALQDQIDALNKSVAAMKATTLK